jgi:hypothetical protein
MAGKLDARVRNHDYGQTDMRWSVHLLKTCLEGYAVHPVVQDSGPLFLMFLSGSGILAQEVILAKSKAVSPQDKCHIFKHISSMPEAVSQRGSDVTRDSGST